MFRAFNNFTGIKCNVAYLYTSLAFAKLYLFKNPCSKNQRFYINDIMFDDSKVNFLAYYENSVDQTPKFLYLPLPLLLI